MKRVERLQFGFATRAQCEAEDAAAEERAQQREKARCRRRFETTAPWSPAVDSSRPCLPAASVASATPCPSTLMCHHTGSVICFCTRLISR